MKQLSLRFCNLHELEASLLCNALIDDPNTELAELILTGNKLGNEGVKHIATGLKVSNRIVNIIFF